MKKNQIKRVPIQVHIPIILDKQFDCPYEEPYGYIYKITNKINGHYYIGKHEFHESYIDTTYKGSGKRLQLAYEKYGIENFDTIILEWTDQDNTELSELEKFWIDIFGAFEFPFHYNLTEGGDGMTSEAMSGENNPCYKKPMSDEQKEKLRIFHTGKKLSKVTREKMGKSKIGKNNPFYGKHHAQESIDKMRANLPNRQGKNNANYGNHKFAGKNHFNYGKHLSIETRQKISIANSGRAHSIQERANVSRPIVKLDYSWGLLQKYYGISFALEELGIKWNGGIVSSCKSKGNRLYKNFRWMYLEDFEMI